MKIDIKIEENAVRASLEGRLDTASAQDCAPDFQTLNEQADKRITLDCNQLNYISSSGLRLLLTLRKEVEAKGGHLIVEHITDEIRSVFTLTGFFKLFDIRS